MNQLEVQRDGKADLHMHTIHSDGTLAPRELVNKAKSVGLSTISITDHDNVNGLDEAIQQGSECNVAVIPGVEISAAVHHKEIHLLGYFFDPHHAQLQNFLSTMRTERIQRAERIVRKLNTMNIPLNIDAVLRNAGNGAVGRPHIANALVQSGYVQSYQEAFDKYLRNGGLAYEPRSEVSPDQVMKIIEQAGGLTFLAHPGRSIEDASVVELIDMGLDGIETIHPSHSQSVVQHFRNIVNEYYLLESGGSDYHGSIKGSDDILGSVTVTGKIVENMRLRLFSKYNNA